MTEAANPRRQKRVMLHDCWRSRIPKALKEQLSKREVGKGEQLSITSISDTWLVGTHFGRWCPWIFQNQSASCSCICYKSCTAALLHSHAPHTQTLADGLLGFVCAISCLAASVLSHISSPSAADQVSLSHHASFPGETPSIAHAALPG